MKSDLLSTQFLMHPIGTIHSPFNHRNETPIQPSRSQETGTVEIFPQFSEGLQDLEGFSHIFLIYVFHQSSGYNLKVTPFLDSKKRGLFSTRFPARPNPIGFSVVRLLNLDGNILTVVGIDVLDGTPLLDIKPYVPEFDVRLETQTGWYKNRRYE
jgi:tRNA-Thr(GGU) m(6)t(6)A37 methyltransferase TsaA